MHRTLTVIRVAGLLVGLPLTLGAGGCARDRRVHTTESVHVEAETVVPTTERVYREEHTTVVHEAEPKPRGLLSGLVRAVGEVLALPFRLVGGLIRAIF